MRPRTIALSLLAAAVAAGAVVLALPDDGAERLRTQSPPTASQVVTDGTRVTATGMVVQVPGRPMRFCAPTVRADIGYPPGGEPAPQYCDYGVDVEGVDLNALDDRREKDGAVEGRATLTGTYRDGVLTVEEQSATRPYAPRPDDAGDVPPCDPPKGGWPRDPMLLNGPGSPEEGDANLLAEQPAMDRYRAEHPGDVVQIRLLRPSPDSVLMGVAARDAAAAERAEQTLRPAYGDRLCVVVSRFSRAQVTAAQDAIDVGGDEAVRLGVHGGAGEGMGEDLQVEVGFDVVMVTEELQRRADQHDGLLVLRPWLVPA